MKQFLLYLFIPILFFSSCTKDNDFTPDEPNPTKEAVQEKDIRYGSDKWHVLDYYLPANRSTTSTKVIILLHGGAWASGDKSEMDPIIDSIKKRFPDWAVFNLNYRLAEVAITGTKNIFPAQEEDVKTALQYIYDRRSQFVISDKWVLAGASAGAHLALLQAYKYNTPVKPKAVVDFFGPTDMTLLYNHYLQINDIPMLLGLNALLNGTPTNNASLYTSSSPITYANTAVPTIIFHGGEDDVVPTAQSETLMDKLASFSIKREYKLYPEQTHGWSDPAIWNDCLNKIQNFLTENVP